MLKNKIIVRKIRNIVILLMAIIIMIGAYKNIDKSRAEDVIEIGAKAIDNYNYLADEEFVLEAKQIEDDLYEIELPEEINGKKINKIVKADSEIVENKIYLTKEQVEKQEEKINIEVEYDIAILEEKEDGTFNKTLLAEKTEEERKLLETNGVIKVEETTQVPNLFYSKILRYEDKENGKQVELKGYLPVNAELQVEELTKEQIAEFFGDKKVEIAYDIKIIQRITTIIPTDEANPESAPEEIVEIIEINPEDFGEKCEVTITDAKIEEKSKVLHVKEDNTLEEVKVTENAEGNVRFEAETFSVYGIENVSDIEVESDSDPVMYATGGLVTVTNSNIGDYIDLGNNIVGTNKTTDDWRILYVDSANGYMVAILANYLPNSTGYAAAAGLRTSSTYGVREDSSASLLISGLQNTNAWNGLANGIEGAMAMGGAWGDLLMASYNYKKGTNLSYTDNPTLSGDLWVINDSTVDSYWLAQGHATSSSSVYRVNYYGVLSTGHYSAYYGVRPIVAIPTTTNIANVNGVLTVVGDDYIDTVPPEISVSNQSITTEYKKTHNVTVNLTDAQSGLATGASLKYGWSTSRTVEPTEYTNVTPSYTNGATTASFTATGAGFTGDYYLWVVPQTLNDVDGNTQTQTFVTQSPFKFDNEAKWEIEDTTVNSTQKTITTTLIAADAHSGYQNNTLDVNDITVYVGGVESNTITKELTANQTTTSHTITNNNIGDYIDLGNNIVGTSTTTDDWRVLYVENGKVYVILSYYLPNSTGYAQNAGYNRTGSYSVWGDENYPYSIREGLASTSSAWQGLTNGISGAVAQGAPTIELLRKSYNYKNGTNSQFQNGAAVSGDLYVLSNVGEETLGYWTGNGYSRK